MNISIENDLEFVRQNIGGGNNPEKQIFAFGILGNLLIDQETRSLSLDSGIVVHLQSSLRFLDSFFLISSISWIDSIRSELIRLNFFVDLIRHFLSVPIELKTKWLSIGFLGPFSTGEDVLNSVAQSFPNFLESLLKLFHELGDNNFRSKIEIAGIILNFVGFFPNTTSNLLPDPNVKDFIISCVKGEKDDKVQSLALEFLMGASSITLSRPFLISLGIQELIQPFIADRKSPLNFVSNLTQALLDGHNHTVDPKIPGKLTTINVIHMLVKPLEKIANSAQQVESQCFHLFESNLGLSDQ